MQHSGRNNSSRQELNSGQLTCATANMPPSGWKQNAPGAFGPRRCTGSCVTRLQTLRRMLKSDVSRMWRLSGDQAAATTPAGPSAMVQFHSGSLTQKTWPWGEGVHG